MGISIIICCYNSSKRLKETLKHLALQRYSSSLECELIVVDNNSSDLTDKCAVTIWDELGNPFPLHVIYERCQGQDNARRTGSKKAKYDIIIFCDDDNWLASDYLNNALAIMNTYPQVGIAGGKGSAVTDGSIPDWFEEYSEGYAVGKQAITSGDVTLTRGYLWGAGMVIRRKVLLDIYESNISLLSGRKGNTITSGDDSEICKWVIKKGYQLWYSENLIFTHFIPSNRLTWEYCKKLYISFSISSIYLNLHNRELKENHLYKFWAHELIYSLQSFFKMCFKTGVSKNLYATFIKPKPGLRFSIDYLCCYYKVKELLINKKRYKECFTYLSVK